MKKIITFVDFLVANVASLVGWGMWRIGRLFRTLRGGWVFIISW
jgi:hypothetical protein